MNVVLNCSEVLEDHKAELAEQIARIIRELMSRTGLEIPTLKEIIVPDDFDAELLAYQEAHDIGERGRTNDEGGLAICKVVEYVESGELAQAIFLDKEQWLGRLFSRDEKDISSAVHWLHHELAHAQDYHFQYQIFGDDFPLPFMNNLANLLDNLARYTWGEYYANRLSADTMPLEEACGTAALYEAVDYVLQEADKAKDLYQLDGDIGALFQRCYELCWRLMYRIGCSLGYFHAFYMIFSESSESLRDTERKTGEQIEPFTEIWEESSRCLLALYESYPNWSGVEDFSKFSGVILKAFNKLRLFPLQSVDAIWVDVR